MKRLLPDRKTAISAFVFAAVILVIVNAAVAGDAIVGSLPQDSPEAVIASARTAVSSGLDEADIVKLTRSMLQHGFDPQQIQTAHAIMIEAKISHMPVAPLMNKTFEGMAKDVEPALILQALEAVHSRNTFAFQRAVRFSDNKERTSKLGRSLSSSLAAGLEKKDADRITKVIQQRATSTTSEQSFHLALECFNTARDISRLGVSSHAVTDMVVGALRSGFSSQQISSMRSAYMVEARQSDPQQLAKGYAAAIQVGKDPSEGLFGLAGESGRTGGAGHSRAGGGGSDGDSGGGGSDGDGGGSGGASGSGGSGGPGPGGGGPGSGGSR